MLATAQQFAEEFAGIQFRHSAALIAGIRDESIGLHSASKSSTQQAAAYLGIYRFRLTHLEGSSPTEHVKSLREDVSILCRSLAQDPNQVCDLWVFSEEPHYIYSVFVGRRTRVVFGCIRGVDDRLIDDRIRRELWGEPKQEKTGEQTAS